MSTGHSSRKHQKVISSASTEIVSKWIVKDAIMNDQQPINKRIFDPQPAEILGILGPPRSGKSTLLRCLDLSLSIEAGDSLGSTSEMLPHQLNRMGSEALRPDLPMFEALLEAFQPYDLSALQTRKQFKRALGLLCREKESAKGSMRPDADTVVALMLALLDPPVHLLLDEPTLGVSRECYTMIVELMRELKQLGQTCIILTMTDPQEAELICDRVVLVNEGRVLAYGTVKAVKGLLQHNLFLSNVATRPNNDIADAL